MRYSLLVLMFIVTASHAQMHEETYDLWCGPKEDLCSLTTERGVIQIDRRELPMRVPMAYDTGVLRSRSLL